MTQFITAPLVVTLIGMTCPACGVKYGLDDRLRSERLADGKTWWCSNGHSLSFRESEVARERRRAEAAEQREKWAKEDALRARAAADRAKRSQRATAGHLTRVRRRVAAGVCPCCNRTFQNLARHMTGQHPEFSPEPATPADGGAP